MKINLSNHYKYNLKNKSHLKNELYNGAILYNKSGDKFFCNEKYIYKGESPFRIKIGQSDEPIINQWRQFNELYFRKKIDEMLPSKKGILCSLYLNFCNFQEDNQGLVFDVIEPVYNCGDLIRDECYITNKGSEYCYVKVIDESIYYKKKRKENEH